MGHREAGAWRDTDHEAHEDVRDVGVAAARDLDVDPFGVRRGVHFGAYAARSAHAPPRYFGKCRGLYAHQRGDSIAPGRERCVQTGRGARSHLELRGRLTRFVKCLRNRDCLVGRKLLVACVERPRVRASRLASGRAQQHTLVRVYDGGRPCAKGDGLQPLDLAHATAAVSGGGVVAAGCLFSATSFSFTLTMRDTPDSCIVTP